MDHQLDRACQSPAGPFGLYARGARGPVLTGDVVGDRRVIGFAYVPEHDPPTSSNDRLLVEGDEVLEVPPVRVVPEAVGEAGAIADLPPCRLPVGRLRRAAELSADLPAVVAATLARAGAPWRSLAGLLIDRLARADHLVWITGVAARDLVAGAAPADVNDLDLSGTTVPGRFTEITRQVLRRHGLGEYVQKVSPERLVCSVAPPLGGVRAIEYRCLVVDGLRFPASGSDLAVDACTRDFTVNSLHYDPHRQVLIDPTGRGVDDLLAPVHRLVSMNSSPDLLVRAAVVVRALKFILRWRENGPVDTAELRRWAESLPADLCARLDESRWRNLVAVHQRSVHDTTPETQREAMRPLGPVATELLEELLRRQGW